jgi:hypothetical protein
MLIDVNLLLYAAYARAPEHERAAAWLEEQLNGDRRVGLPWESLVGFVRLATNPRVSPTPLDPSEAWSFVDEWLAVRLVWTPMPTDAHARVLGGLIAAHRLTGKLIPDAHLAALAIEHGLDVYSADTDFSRFPEIRWINPLAS